MNQDSLHQLVADVFADQIETDAYELISDSRFHEVLTSQKEFTAKEQSLLILSPRIRSDYQRIRLAIKDEAYSSILKSNIATKILPLAASSNEQEQIILAGSGYRVILYRPDEPDTPWLVLVQLEKIYQDILRDFSHTPLRLFDSGGLEWLRGKPNSYGEISATWTDANMDLAQRASQYSLHLEPV